MFEPLAPVATAAAMFGGLFTALSRGWLYTGKSVRDLKEQHAAQLTELRDQWNARLSESQEREQAWREAHNLRAAQAATATAQTAELMQSFGVLEQWIRATPAAIAKLHSVPPPEQTEGNAS